MNQMIALGNLENLSVVDYQNKAPVVDERKLGKSDLDHVCMELLTNGTFSYLEKHSIVM